MTQTLQPNMPTDCAPAWLPVPLPLTAHTWPVGTQPAVSICCITYNHKDFIAEAIDSFLMQETTFPVEIIINDDASTDGTAAIVRDYQTRYPGLIRAIIQAENQYSKKNIILARLLVEAGGKYAALCEGDDYWSCKQKLQKQVLFLESNPNVSICFHDAFSEVYDEDNNLTQRTPLYPTSPGSIFKFEDFARGFAPHTASCLILNRKSVFVWLLENKLRFAKTIFYALTEHGETAVFLPEKMSVYRIHRGGVYSCLKPELQFAMSNSGLWANRRAFPSKHHKRLFSLKLLENYTALLRIHLQNRMGIPALSSLVMIIRLLLIPPSPTAIVTFSGRLLSFIGRRIRILPKHPDHGQTN